MWLSKAALIFSDNFFCNASRDGASTLYNPVLPKGYETWEQIQHHTKRQFSRRKVTVAVRRPRRSAQPWITSVRRPPIYQTYPHLTRLRLNPTAAAVNSCGPATAILFVKEHDNDFEFSEHCCGLSTFTCQSHEYVAAGCPFVGPD